MRKFRILTLSFVVMVVVAAPNVFAKVCHPKKAITCDAAELSRPAAPQAVAPVTAPAAKADKAEKVESIESPVKVQQAMICGPWIRYCRANSLV